MSEISFSLKPVSLTQRQLALLLVIGANEIPDAKDIRPGILGVLSKNGLIKIDPTSAATFELTIAGRGLVDNLPLAVSQKQCSACLSKHPFRPSENPVAVMFAEPTRGCSACGRFLFPSLTKPGNVPTT